MYTLAAFATNNIVTFSQGLHHAFESWGTILRAGSHLLLTSEGHETEHCLHIFHHYNYDVLVLTCTKFNYITVACSCQKVKYLIELNVKNILFVICIDHSCRPHL